MKGQPPGLSQYQLTQQSNYEDMQLWQQQMYKQQLQELQRQQQIQQLGQESHQQSLISHIPALTRNSSVNQLPIPINGMPLHGSNFNSWPDEYTRNNPKMSYGSQMMAVGSAGLASTISPSNINGFSNGLMLSPDQCHTLQQPMGIAPQQVDQSLYGMPVSSMGNSSNQFSQFHVLSQDSSEPMAGSVPNRPATLMAQSAFNSFQGNRGAYTNQNFAHSSGPLISKQDAQIKQISGRISSGALTDGCGNFQQMNPLDTALQVQESHVRDDQIDLQGKFQEKAPRGAIHSSTGLDPTEQKILFSSDDDTDWMSSLGMGGNTSSGGYQSKNPSEGAEPFSSFSSFHSGSWSALMQSAVAEVSSSDMGPPDDWRNLSSQKLDSHSQDRNAVPSNIRPMPQSGNRLHSQSSLGNRDASASNSKASSFQQPSLKFTNDLERVHVDISHENNKNRFHENFYQKDGTQSGQVYERPVLDTKAIDNASLSLNNLECSSASKQNSPLYTSSSQFNGSRYGNNASGLQLARVEMSSKGSASETMKHPDQSSGNFRNFNAQGNYGMNISNNDQNPLVAISRVQSAVLDPHMPKKNEDVNQMHQHNFEHGKNVFPKASENSGDGHQLPNKGLQVWASLASNSYKASADVSDRKHAHGSQSELYNDSSRSNHPHADNSSDTGFVAGRANDSQTFVSGNQKSEQLTSNQISNLQRPRNHPLESFVSGLNDTQKQMLYAQMLFRGSKVHGQELSKHAMPNNTLDADMGRGNDPQGNARNLSNIHVPGSGSSSGNHNNNQDSRVAATFDKPTTAMPHSSQNLVQLLHKVDQSRSNDTVSGFGVNQSLVSNSNTPMVSGAFATNMRHVQNASMQGYGLRLAPPSQLPPIPNKVHPYGTSQGNYDRNLENHGSEVEDKQISWTSTPVRFPSTLHSKEASKNNVFDTKTSVQSTSSSGTPASPSYTRNQLHLAQISGAIGHMSTQKETDSHRIPNGSCSSAVDGSPQQSLPDLPNRFQPFRAASSAGLIDSQSLPSDAIPSYIRNSGHLSLPESQNILQSPNLFGASQRGGFSGTSHHVWPTQQLAANLSEKSIPLQSMGPKHIDMMSTVLPETANPDTDTGEESQHMDVTDTSPDQLHGDDETESSSSFRQQMLSENAKFTSQVASLPQEQEPLRSQTSEGNSLPCSINESDGSKDKNGQNLLSEHKLDQPLLNVNSNSDVHGINFRQTISHGHHYSLLQQMHAMKALEANSNNLIDKRVKGMDNYMDAKRSVGSTPQSHNVIYGNRLMSTCAADGELSAVVQQNLFPSDSKMLTFSSTGTNIQASGSSRQSDIQISSSAPISSSAFTTVIEPRKISPQMAPSWFGHYGTPRLSNSAAIYSGTEIAQKNLKVVAEHHLSANSTGNTGSVIVPARNDDTGQNGYLGQTAVTAIGARDKSAFVQTVSSDVCDQNLLPKTKKRKSVELLPWHKEIKQGSNRLRSIRTARMDWAQATNRLLEKVEDEVELRDDVSKIHRTRRRLLRTTHLMQELMPLVPARLLVEPTASSYEKILYLIAKLGLGDACGLLSCLGEARRLPSESLISGKLKISEKWVDQRFVKVLDTFIGRSKKLESDLLRLEKKASLLDVRVECQDLERFSIINRFAKFHGGSQLSSGFEGSSTPESSHKMPPQRFITALNIPGNNLEGVICLSL